MKFQIGDRVRCVEPYQNEDILNEIGTVRCINSGSNGDLIGVEFDNNINGHNDHSVEYGYSWNVPEDCLKLVGDGYMKLKYRLNKKHLKIEKKLIYINGEVKDAELMRKELLFILKTFDISKEKKKQIRKQLTLFKIRWYVTYKKVNTFFTFDENQHTFQAYEYINQRLVEKIRAERRCRRVIKETGRYFPDGSRYLLCGGVHPKKNTFLLHHHKTIVERIYKRKSPKLDDPENYVGVEIEFHSPCHRNELADIFFNEKLYNNCTLMCDASLGEYEDIHGTYYYGHELCIFAREDEINNLIKRAINILENECHAEINDDCGLHIHIDARNRNQFALFSKLIKCEKLLFNLVDQNRENSEYCQRLNIESKDAKGIWQEAGGRIGDIYDGYDKGRYYAVNGPHSYNKHQTIEVRLHQGTLEYKEITNWLKLLLSIANYNGVLLEDVEHLEKLNNAIDADIMEYYKPKLRKEEKVNQKEVQVNETSQQEERNSVTTLQEVYDYGTEVSTELFGLTNSTITIRDDDIPNASATIPANDQEYWSTG
jgi:hypothetical protein